MLKIRRPLGRLIFNMGITIPGKTVFLIETAPWCHAGHTSIMKGQVKFFQHSLYIAWFSLVSWKQITKKTNIPTSNIICQASCLLRNEPKSGSHTFQPRHNITGALILSRPTWDVGDNVLWNKINLILPALPVFKLITFRFVLSTSTGLNETAPML